MKKSGHSLSTDALRLEFAPLDRIGLCAAVSALGQILYPGDWREDDVFGKTPEGAERCNAVWGKLRQWLNAKCVASWVIGSDGLQYRVKPHIWAQPERSSLLNSLKLEVHSGSIVGGYLVAGFVLLDESDFQKMLLSLAQETKSQPTSTAGARTSCEAWLGDLGERWTAEDGPKPKRDELLEKAKEQFGQVRELLDNLLEGLSFEAWFARPVWVSYC